MRRFPNKNTISSSKYEPMNVNTNTRTFYCSIVLLVYNENSIKVAVGSNYKKLQKVFYIFQIFFCKTLNKSFTL